MTLAELLARITDPTTLTDDELGLITADFAAWGAANRDTVSAEDANAWVAGFDSIAAERTRRNDTAAAAAAADDPARQAMAARLGTADPPAGSDPAAAGEDDTPGAGTLETSGPAFSAEDLTTAVTAGVAAALAAQPATVPAAARRAPVAAMSSPPNSDPTVGGHGAGRYPAQIVAAANVPNHNQGEPFASWPEIVEAATEKLNTFGPGASGGGEEKVTVARIVASADDEHTLGSDKQANAWKVRQATSAEKLFDNLQSLMASGGLAAPVTPYYSQLVIAEPIRPVRDALEVFMAPRGGIRTILPPHIGDLQAVAPGIYTDGHATSSSTGFTSATAAFKQTDVGQPIVELDANGNVITTHIAAGTTIATVTNGTTIVLSQNAAGTSTTVRFQVGGRNPNNLGAAVGIVTVSQDAAGAIKSTYDATPAGQVEYDVQSIYASVQFPNLGARAWPEYVEAVMRLSQALWARTADSNLLDQIKANSTTATLAETFGSARQVLAQLGHAASYYRNHNRTDPQMPLICLLPAWLVDNMVGDNVSSLVFENDFYGVGFDEMVGFLRDRNLVIYPYVDSAGFNAGAGTQLFAAATSNAALPDYPMVSGATKAEVAMFSPGTHLFLDSGILDLGLVRDSVLVAQNKFRNFTESFETSAYVGVESLWLTMTVCANGSYGAAATIACSAGSGL